MTAFSERDSRSKGPVGSNMNVYVLVMNLKIRLTKLGISPDNDWNLGECASTIHQMKVDLLCSQDKTYFE